MAGIKHSKICNSVWNDPEKHDELKCSKAFKSFQFVYVNGSYIEAEGDYAGGCPYGDPHCEDVVKFEFPVFNLLFLGKFHPYFSSRIMNSPYPEEREMKQ